MSKSRGLFVAVWFSALALAGALANSAFAAEPVRKDIQQNEKVRVYEAIYQPGDTAEIAKRSMRVVHAIEGGMIERIYADGTKKADPWKTGETRIIDDEQAYAVKNAGKGVVRFLIVVLK